MKWNPTKALRDWLEARFELEPVVRLLRENLTKPVPAHVNWLFTLGSVLAALLAVQLFTGVLLMFHYKPSGQEAFQSVQHITYDVPLGWLIRSAHNWGSHLIVVLALLHLARVLVYGGYKKPRELTWGVGVALLAIILGFGFTGYLLPWDQVAYWGTVVATEAPASIPVVGPLTREFMIGGTEVADPTLGRFYVVHVILLPVALIALVGLHLLLIRYHGTSPLSGTDQPEPGADEIRRQGGKPFLPHHALRDSAAIYVAIGALMSLALLLPPHLGDMADPLITPPGIKPEWYFLPAYQLLKYVPEVVGVQVPPLVLVLLLLLPILFDRSSHRHPRRRLRVLVVATAAAAVICFLGLLGHLSDTQQALLGKTYDFDVLGRPHAVKEGVAEGGSSGRPLAAQEQGMGEGGAP